MIERHAVTDRESWLALRRQNINASEIGVVCGAGGYGSRAELYAEKKGLRPPLEDDAVLRRGRWAEAAIFEALADQRPEWDVRRARVYLRDPDLRLGATPDGFAMAPGRDGFGIVQGKAVARSVFRRAWLEDPDASIAKGAATPPLMFQLQILTEERLSDCGWGVLAVIITGEFDWQFRLFDVPRHLEAEARILEDVAAFWRDWLDPGVMPPFDPQRDEALVRILYPADDGTEIDLSADNRAAELVDDLIERRAGRRRLEAEIEPIETELRGKLGPHTYGLLGDGRRIVCKVTHRKAYSVPASEFRSIRIGKADAQPEEQSDNEQHRH